MGWGRLWRPAGDLDPSELLSASDLTAGLSVRSDLVSISDALVAFITCSFTMDTVASETGFSSSAIAQTFYPSDLVSTLYI